MTGVRICHLSKYGLTGESSVQKFSYKVLVSNQIEFLIENSSIFICSVVSLILKSVCISCYQDSFLGYREML
jgi:hypothetical protein